jgi:hypothetical protein
MTYTLRGDHRTEDRRLDRLPPSDWRHYEKFPLTAAIRAEMAPVPVMLGINWYTDFERPQQDSNGRWWIGRSRYLGPLLGGHAITVKPVKVTDNLSWWKYYDQGEEGRCAQFAASRVMSLLNRTRYEIRADDPQGHWLYWEAQKIDDWPGGSYPKASPFYEGTSVRAVLDIVRQHGMIRYGSDVPSMDDGIIAYRWLRTAAEVAQVTGYGRYDYVPLLNSWGITGYPHIVYIPLTTLDLLIAQDGEAAVPTDR